MSAGNRLPIFSIPTIFILLLIFTCKTSSGRTTSPTPPTPPSSCGNFTDIKSPFRLKTHPITSGYNNTNFQLNCLNNRTLTLNPRKGYQTRISRTYFVQRINYTEHRVRLVDPGTKKENLSSCPVNEPWDLHASGFRPYDQYFGNYEGINTAVAFIHCLFPVNSTKYVEASFCGDTSNIFGNASKFYSYVMVGDSHIRVSDLEDSCTMDKLGWVLTRGPIMDKSSLFSIYNGLAYGFEISWYDTKFCNYSISSCVVAIFSCLAWILLNLATGEIILALRLVIFIIGIPFLIWFVVHKWRRRHLSMDKTIENFLQDQYNLAPIQYTYSDVKKMTKNFNQILGEGGYSTVYKGKLRSGPYVAIKMMNQSIASEKEFINEVGTVGRIHHVNIVQLIGFCVERSKYALVYEFLPNGSLDKYIFNLQNLEILALPFNKMFEIALGVAHGISYLHHGCNMQILHFDIKPHNILLDEKFNPKISDFGLARLHPSNESFINLTVARGTMGYMAPEMFYRNIGGISYKADVYSFGMMLMVMAGRRKNINHLVEDINQVYFPLWVYDQLCAGKDIEIKDAVDQAERKMVKKIMIVALWCIQMKPSNRPPINKVVDMLEGESEPPMPPKPFVAPRETTINDCGITHTYDVDYVSLNVGEN